MTTTRNCLQRSLIAAVACLFAVGGAGAQETIRIGTVLPMSGPNADYVNRGMIVPTELAVKEINAAGGLLGRKVELMKEDSRFDGPTAVSALFKLASNNVVAVVTGFTPLVMPQLPVAEEKKVIVLATSTEHPDLTKSPWAVRMTPQVDIGPKLMAKTAWDMGMKTVATLAEDQEALRLAARIFSQEFERLGGKILIGEVIKAQDNDVRGQLTKLRESKADAMYFVSQNSRVVALALRQLAEVGYKPKQIFGNPVFEDREVMALPENIRDNLIYSTIPIDPAFAKRFKEATTFDADAFAARTYASTMLLFDAIKRANSLDHEKIRDAIYNFGEYSGVAGKYRYTGTGEPRVLNIMIVKNGVPTEVTQN